jgi:hypothetical protein
MNDSVTRQANRQVLLVEPHAFRSQLGAFRAVPQELLTAERANGPDAS